MKLSEIGLDEVKKYIRVTDNEDDGLITSCMWSAREFIFSQTGLTPEEADGCGDLYYAFMCLCSDMYNVRDMTVQQDRLNPIADGIMKSHRRNLIM